MVILSYTPTTPHAHDSNAIYNDTTIIIKGAEVRGHKVTGLDIDTKKCIFLCVCPVIDHKFRHHFVKVAVDPRGDSRVDPQTTLTM